MWNRVVNPRKGSEISTAPMETSKENPRNNAMWGKKMVKAMPRYRDFGVFIMQGNFCVWGFYLRLNNALA